MPQVEHAFLYLLHPVTQEVWTHNAPRGLPCDYWGRAHASQGTCKAGHMQGRARARQGTCKAGYIHTLYGLYILILATDMNKHNCLAGPGSNEEEEGLSPLAHVMDDSGAPPAGTLDPGGGKGVVEMPDSEALRRSVAAANAAEHERQLASSNVSQPVFEGERGPVPATSSGVSHDTLSDLIACWNTICASQPVGITCLPCDTMTVIQHPKHL